MKLEKLNFPGTDWRGLALIGAQKKTLYIGPQNRKKNPYNNFSFVKRENPCKFTFRYKTMLFFWPGLVPAVKTMLFSKQDWEEATKIRGVWTGR